MKTEQLESFTVIGRAVRTSNENGQAAQDIGNLWALFMNDTEIQDIKNKSDQTVYAVYTNYAGDHTKPYTMILGYKVNKNEETPDGMLKCEIKAGNYQKYTAQGDLTKDAVVNQWQKVWQDDLNRDYQTDIEVYDERSIDPTNGIADIYIGII